MIKRFAILRLSQPAASAITAVAACRRRALVRTAFIVVLALAAWASVGCETDPYFDDVADIWSDFNETRIELLSDFSRNADQCIRFFSITVCDRGLDNMRDMSAETRSARRAVERLDPPPEAAIWHRDYLRFLDDAAAVLNDTVSVMSSGDLDNVNRVFADMESMDRREADLMERFEEIR